MNEGGSIVVGGRASLFGTVGVQSVVLLGGDVQFDASFNRGGDTIAFPQSAPVFLAHYSGSSLVVSNGALTATIPIGMVGMSLVFSDATHWLVYDGTNVFVGRQVITTTPTPLTDA